MDQTQEKDNQPDNLKLESRIRPPSRPKFNSVKYAYDIFRNRVTQISRNNGPNLNVHRLNYLHKMEKLRDRVNKLLKSYPNFTPDPKKVDSWKVEINDNMKQKLSKLATPPKRSVKETLILVNHMIREIIDDHQYSKNRFKLKRVYELLQYRNQVCCAFSKYKDSPSDAQPDSCYQFRRCSSKPAPVYACFDAVSEPSSLKKFRSRCLKFTFDNDTNKLALPNLRRINEALAFYSNQCNQLNFQMSLMKSEKEKEKIKKMIFDVVERISIVAAFKNECEAVEQKDARNIDVTAENQVNPRKFTEKYPNAEAKICYGLPVGWKLKLTLDSLKNLQRKICCEKKWGKLEVCGLIIFFDEF